MKGETHDFAEFFLLECLLFVDFISKDDEGHVLQFRHLHELIELSL